MQHCSSESKALWSFEPTTRLDELEQVDSLVRSFRAGAEGIKGVNGNQSSVVTSAANPVNWLAVFSFTFPFDIVPLQAV